MGREHASLDQLDLEIFDGNSTNDDFGFRFENRTRKSSSSEEVKAEESLIDTFAFAEPPLNFSAILPR